MAILNYTTSISTEKTFGEIQRSLAEAGAQALISEFDQNCVMISISFRLYTPYGVIMFKLPANIDGVFKALEDNRVPNKYRTKEQAARVAWRIVKVWVQAQLAMVEAEQASMMELFLPYAQNDKGKTIYESLEETKFKQIAHSNA